MSERLPDRLLPGRVHAFRLAQQGRRLEGSLSGNALKRLSEGLTQVPEVVWAALDFHMDASNRAVLEIQVRAELVLQCQRCLESMTWPLVAENRFVLSKAETGDANTPNRDEVLSVDDETLVIADLVEEEILLALPLAPMHEPIASCGVGTLKEFTRGEAEAARDEADNPFAVLKKLKPN